MRDALLWSWLAAASLVGLVLAAADKRRAGKGRRRVPEDAFHFLALLGGWPGELLGFLLVRHKVRKARFLVPFALCAVANVLLVVAVLGRWPG